MTTTTRPLSSSALLDLRRVLAEPPAEGRGAGSWRWIVRKHMAGVRDELLHEGEHSQDAWLAARNGTMARERDALLRRLTALGGPVLESPDLARVRSDLLRLVTDIGHHVQRLHDLAYDDIELELGGSE